jgi:hypothetical protein
VQKPVVEPPKVDRRLEPDGSGPVSGAHGDDSVFDAAVVVTSVRSWVGRAGGHDEVLRVSRGEAAGEELGAHPVERCVVNVGMSSEIPLSRPARSGSDRLIVS